MSERTWFDDHDYDDWQVHRRAHGLRGPRCNAVGCYARITRWALWRSRKSPARQQFCGGCNRRFARAWRDWTGASLRSRLSVRNEDQP